MIVVNVLFDQAIGLLRGMAIYQFGENLILALRKPACKRPNIFVQLG